MLPCVIRILQAINFCSWKDDPAKLLGKSKIFLKLNKRIKKKNDTHRSQWKTLREKISRELDLKD